MASRKGPKFGAFSGESGGAFFESDLGQATA